MAVEDKASWPELRAEARPWTRWWWMGNALNEQEITRSMEAFHEAGIGGVEVSPIYGPKGAEDRYVSFLSPRWIELLGHTIREGKRLGMGVDLIAGTGWPYGGPWVTDADSPKQAILETVSVAGGSRLTEPLRCRRKPEAPLLAVTAVAADGKALDLTAHADAAGNLDWTAPPGDKWTLYALFLARTAQQVKRAAPGGEGNVLDHFSAPSVRRYLEAFDAPFNGLPEGEMVRCIFNDSWEVFGATATPHILDEFARRRGYDPRAHLHHLKGDGDPDMARRVRSDYRETIGDLVREDFLGTWSNWTHSKKAKTRNQAHGSPGNLLDLYAAADVPETEMFGPTRLALGGLKPISSIPPDFGEEEELLLCKMASSAAHVAGKPLCSSESFTWLGEHAKVPLAHAKAEADILFALGINHIFFHGTPFSPSDAEWPGWLFYASTLFAPTNPFWRDMPAFNAYLARCQSILQTGTPDNDVLVYFPFYDLLAGEAGVNDLLTFLSFHKTNGWLKGNLPEFVRIMHLLWEHGWAYDLVSDRQISSNIVASQDGLQASGGAHYKTVLVAGCKLAPPETIERLIELARQGATIAVVGELPTDVPGLGHLDERRARLQKALKSLGTGEEKNGIRHHAIGKGQFLVGNDTDTLLTRAGIAREALTDRGIEFHRRRDADGGHTYFLSNPGTKDASGWVPLVHTAPTLTVLDPMFGTIGAGVTRPGEHGGTEVYLPLPSGASLIVRTGPSGTPTPRPWPYLAPAGEAHPLTGNWKVEFLEGGPTLPPTRTLPTLSDWTTWQEDTDALRNFSGTARYTLTFDAPQPNITAWELSLGEVCHSAHIRLNGKERGTVFSRPYHTLLEDLKPTGNTLEIEVTNLMANRLSEVERRKGDTWRPFLMVNINYKPFDAATWEPLPSGLIGPVTLTPLRLQLPD
jgi:hypothetical protein